MAIALPGGPIIIPQEEQQLLPLSSPQQQYLVPGSAAVPVPTLDAVGAAPAPSGTSAPASLAPAAAPAAGPADAPAPAQGPAGSSSSGDGSAQAYGGGTVDCSAVDWYIERVPFSTVHPLEPQDLAAAQLAARLIRGTSSG